MNRLERRVKALEVNRHTVADEQLLAAITFYKQELSKMSDDQLNALLAVSDEPGPFSDKFTVMSDEELIAVILGGEV